MMGVAQRAAKAVLAAWAALVCTGMAHAQAVDGAALFAQHCATCHRADAMGTAGLAPALTGSHWQKLGATPDYPLRVMLFGLSGAIRVNGSLFVGAMPAQTQLSDAEAAALYAHLRTLQGDSTTATAQEVTDLATTLRAHGGNAVQNRALRKQTLGE